MRLGYDRPLLGRLCQRFAKRVMQTLRARTKPAAACNRTLALRDAAGFADARPRLRYAAARPNLLVHAAGPRCRAVPLSSSAHEIVRRAGLLLRILQVSKIPVFSE